MPMGERTTPVSSLVGPLTKDGTDYLRRLYRMTGGTYRLTLNGHRYSEPENWAGACLSSPLASMDPRGQSIPGALSRQY